MQKHGGPFALDHGECSPFGEDGEAIEIAMEGTPWKSHTIIFLRYRQCNISSYPS